MVVQFRYITFGNLNGWQNFNSDSRFYYQYNFDTVCIHCVDWYGINSTSDICGVIPSEIRPTQPISLAGVDLTSGGTVSAVKVLIGTDGNIRITPSSPYKLNFSVTYKYR